MQLGAFSGRPVRIVVGLVAFAGFAFIATLAGRAKVHDKAVGIAAAHPIVTKALGTPIEQSGLLGTSTRLPSVIGPDRYERDLTITGPKGKGTLRMMLEESRSGRRGRRGWLTFGGEERQRLIGLHFQAAGTEYWQDLFSDERPPWVQEGEVLPQGRPASSAQEAPPPPPPGGWVPLKPPPDGAPAGRGPPVMAAEPVKLKEW